MKYLVYFRESLEEEMSLLKDLSADLSDDGLFVSVSSYNPHFYFEDSIYLKIEDTNQVYCKEYPKNDMDWLVDKPIILDFFKRLEKFGMVRDRDYKVYGGGLSVTLIFDKKGRESIKL
jgi:hypothetical protein